MPPDDGTLEIPINSSEDCIMATDLPPAVAQQLMTESVGNISANNRDGRNVGTIAMGVLQGAAARSFDELGVAESRSVSGVMATPIASPATQQG